MTDQYQPAGSKLAKPISRGAEAATPPLPSSTAEESSPRAAATATSRRRRQDTSETGGMKLYVPEAAKDPNYAYRWLNDDPGRIHQKTQLDDWDLVGLEDLKGLGEPEKQAENGTRVSRFAEKGATGAGGKPRKMFLARKPKEFYEDDRRKTQAKLSATEESLRHGAPPVSGSLNGAAAYVPDGKNTINGR